MTSQEEFVGVMSSSNWTWQRHTTGWNGLVSLRDHIHLFRDRDSLSSGLGGPLGVFCSGFSLFVYSLKVHSLSV